MSKNMLSRGKIASPGIEMSRKSLPHTSQRDVREGVKGVNCHDVDRSGHDLDRSGPYHGPMVSQSERIWIDDYKAQFNPLRLLTVKQSLLRW